MRFQCGRCVGRTQSERFLHLIRVIRSHVRIVIRGIRSVICSIGGFGGICSIVACNRCIVIVVYHRKIDGFNGISGRCVSCNIVSRNIIDGLV